MPADVIANAAQSPTCSRLPESGWGQMVGQTLVGEWYDWTMRLVRLQSGDAEPVGLGQRENSKFGGWAKPADAGDATEVACGRCTVNTGGFC